MSTYGKRALNKWDYQYSEENIKRYNSTPAEFQLEILKNWYPVGMVCLKYNKFFRKYDNTLYEIVGYDTIGAGTIHQLKLKKEIRLGTNDKVYYENITTHPIQFKPTDEWIKQFNRDKKLNDLLG
jgi:hypothetical protein